MNRDEIIRMAREAGCEIRNGYAYNPHTGSLDQMLKRFYRAAYAAGAAAEREACAIAGAAAAMAGKDYVGVAAAIRARGQA